MSNRLFEAVDNAFNEDRITAPVGNKVMNEDSIDSSEAEQYIFDEYKENGQAPSYEYFINYIMDIPEEEFNQAVSKVNNVVDNITTYTNDDGTDYIELSDNSTVNQLDNPNKDMEDYNILVDVACKEFEEQTGTELYLLGRSGRHVCVELNYENAKNFESLASKVSELEQGVIDSFNESEDLKEETSLKVGDVYKNEYGIGVKIKGIDKDSEGTDQVSYAMIGPRKGKESHHCVRGIDSVLNMLRDNNYKKVEENLKEQDSVQYYIEEIGFNPYEVDYSQDTEAEKIIDTFKEAGKLDSLFDYITAGLTEPFETEEDYLRYVAGTDIEDYEIYNGPLEEALSDNSGQKRISRNVKVMNSNGTYIVLKNGSNVKEFDNEQEAIKYAKNLEKSNLNETILSDDQESILSDIINDLTNLQSTIEHEIEDELLTINNKIKEANKIDGVLIDEIEMSSFNQTIFTTIEDIKREIRISDMEKEEINESEGTIYTSSDMIYDKMSELKRSAKGLETYNKVVKYFEDKGYSDVEEAMKYSDFFAMDITDEELKDVKNIIGFKYKKESENLKERTPDYNIDYYINLFQKVIDQKDTSSFKQALNGAVNKLRSLPSEGKINKDLYYASLSILGRNKFDGNACMEILNMLKDAKENLNESEDLSEAEIPEQLIKNAIELKAIKSRTGKSDYSSEAGRRWNELYKENKSNISADLGDSYTASIGYGGDIQISASHPYDDTQYSWAKANISDGRIVSWSVNIPNYGFKDADTTEEALDLVKMADTWIKTGKSTKGYEGITTTDKPKLSFEEFAKQYRDR